MSTNVTYLLGAGASAECLPVINNFTERLNFFKSHLENYAFNSELQSVAGLKELIQDVNWIINNAKSHQTIDTLAKKFFHKGGNFDELQKLKTVLIIFLTYEQFFPTVYTNNVEEYIKKESIDKRYDSFIASIIKNDINKIELYDHIKVLSWNYDLQFELSFRNYVDDAIFIIQRKLQSIPNREIMVSDVNFDHAKFGIIRLNGLALTDYVEQENNYRTFFDLGLDKSPKEEGLRQLLKLYVHLSENRQKTEILRLFNYSWEANTNFKEKHNNYTRVLEIAKEVSEKTEVLVVIGYSFPFFNREIDRMIIEQLPQYCTIYIQDKEANERVEQFKTSFKNSLRSKNIVAVKSYSSFYLPPQL